MDSCPLHCNRRAKPVPGTDSRHETTPKLLFCFPFALSHRAGPEFVAGVRGNRQAASVCRKHGKRSPDSSPGFEPMIGSLHRKRRLARLLHYLGMNRNCN